MTTSVITSASKPQDKIEEESVVPYSSTGGRVAREAWSQPPATHYVLYVVGSVVYGHELEHYLTVEQGPEGVDPDRLLDEELELWEQTATSSWLATEAELEEQS